MRCNAYRLIVLRSSPGDRPSNRLPDPFLPAREHRQNSSLSAFSRSASDGFTYRQMYRLDECPDASIAKWTPFFSVTFRKKVCRSTCALSLIRSTSFNLLFACAASCFRTRSTCWRSSRCWPREQSSGPVDSPRISFTYRSRASLASCGKNTFDVRTFPLRFTS